MNASYEAVLSHYGVEATRTNPRSSHENGVVEQRHRRLKNALDQALILRGSRDFDLEEEYREFYAHALVAVCREMDVRFSITIRQHKGLRNLIEAIPEADWRPIPYWMDGAADVAEITCRAFQSEPDAAPVRLIVRRVKPTPGSQLALFAAYSFHGFITDRDGETLELEADHRRHAEVENAIRDLKYGVGLNHLPSMAASPPTAPGWRYR